MDSEQDIFKIEIKEEVIIKDEYDIEEEKLSSIKQGSFLKEEDIGGQRSSLKREFLDSDEDILNIECDGEDFTKNRNNKVQARKNKIKKIKRKYPCPVCLKKFFNVKTHILSHTRETPFKCEVCNQSFSHQTSLSRHMILHSEVSPFKCLQCGKKYSDSYQLKYHSFSHSDEKPFKCEICLKTFATKIHLRSHKAEVHFELSYFKCDVCKKEFKRRHHMERHSKIHLNEKPEFACASCGKKFHSKWHLRRHIRQKHD